MDAPLDEVTVSTEFDDGRTIKSPPIGAPTSHQSNPLSWNDILARYADVVAHGPSHLVRPER
jgi:hypothetical protein